MLRAALIIGRKEVAQRLRDWSFFVIGIVAPLALAFIFNIILGGVFGGSPDLDLRLGVYDADAGPVSDGFMAALRGMEEGGIATLTIYNTAEAAEAAVDADAVGAAFVIPENLSNLVILGQPVSIRVIGGVGNAITTSIANSIVAQFSQSVHVGAVAARAGIATGVLGPDEVETVATEAAQSAQVFALTITEVRSRQLPAATFFAAGLGMFFVFFVAGMAVASVAEERRNGTLARLLAAPVPGSAILAGKAGAGIILGIVALVILAVASTLIMGADWGNPLMAFVVIVAAVVAVTGIMMLVGGFARTGEQAQALQAIIGVTLAMLGGTFVPIAAEGGLMGTIRFLTPNAWYVAGLGDVVGGAYGAAFQAVLVLLMMGVVTGAIGLVVAWRRLRP